MNLDDAYANGAYIDNADDYPSRWQREAAAFRNALSDRVEIDVAYGPTSRQVFDFFHPEGIAKGTVIFIHGGYWKAFDKSFFSHFAAGCLAQGWSVAMPSYDLCPDVRINEITEELAQAVQAIAKHTDGPIALTGHSAGGHLAARMLDPVFFDDALRARISAVVPISPVADLEPLLRTTMNEVLQLDAAEARAESVTRMPVPSAVEVTVWVGADERPAFLDQATWLALAWNCAEVVVPGKHHFDVIDGLKDADSKLVQTLTKTI
ncbi:MAG: alpha/beta hydrolase [Sulfitobacter sp.]